MNIRPPQTYGQSSGIQAHHITDYLRVIYKRRWTAALALVAVFVYSAMGILKQTPIYEASVRLLIEKEARRATSLNSVLGEQSSSFYDDDFYPTQRKVLESRGLAWRAIQSLGLNARPTAAPVESPAQPAAQPRQPFLQMVTDWVSNAVGAPKKIAPPPVDENSAQSAMISGFLGGLSVEPLKNTRIFDIRYRSADPEFAKKAANAVADAYIKQTSESRTESTSEATQFVAKALEDQAKKVQSSEEALQRWIEANGTVPAEDRSSPVSNRLTDVNAQLIKAQGDRIEKEQQWLKVQELQKQGRERLETFSGILNNPEVQRYRVEIGKKTQERESLVGKVFQPGAVEIQQIDQSIKDLTTKMYAEEDKVVAAISNELAVARAMEQSYQRSRDQENQNAIGLNKKTITYSALDRVAKADREMYNNLLARMKEGSVSSQYKGSSIEIMDRAETPRSPVLPQTQQELLMAFLKGCVLALGLVFGFEYLDSRIKTPDELKSHLGLSFLGIVPSVHGKESEDPLLLHADVPPGFSEALRAIRTSLIFSSADEGARAIVITSTAPGEGKTLVSTNLAVALAHAGLRTLIIDGDMRRPRTHTVFDRPQEPGLSNVLVGTARLRDSVRNTEVPNLFLLAAGHIPPNPAELLGSTRYLELLDEMRQEYDWVLIDAPPVMAVTDASILANSATGVVFVVGAEMTSRRNAVAAIEQLTAARAKFIGAVLNRVDLKRHSYYYSPYYRKDYAQVYERAAR